MSSSVSNRQERVQPRSVSQDEGAFSVPINARALRAFYGVLGVINIVLLGAFALIQTQVLRPGMTPIHEADPALQLNLTNEGGVLAVWYSSALFLLIGIASLADFWRDGATRRGERHNWLRYGWLFLAAVGLFLSADETAQLHEGVGFVAGFSGRVKVEGLTDYNPGFAWIVIFAPIVFVSAVFLLAFFARWLSSRRVQALAFAGVLFWAANPLLEAVESQIIRVYGDTGLSIQRFVEESTEIIGSTLLLIAVLESLLVYRDRVTPTARAGRGWVVFGALSPLLLVPLTGLAWAVNDEVHTQLGSIGYQYAGARAMMIMDNVDRWGHHLVVAEGCDLTAFQSVFPHEVREGGLLVDYPPPAMRSPSPELSLTVLRFAGHESPEQVAEGLTRVAMLSSHLWHLQCGDTTAADRVVDGWLAERFPGAERLWLPGIPPMSLTRVAPAFPLPDPGLAYDAGNPVTFGDGLIVLAGQRLAMAEVNGETVIRLLLFWRTEGPVSRDYHVFTHLVDGAGNLVAPSDGVPGYDRYPFAVWTPGGTMVDSYDIPVPDGTRLEDAQLRVGLYDFESKERLPVAGSDYVTIKDLVGN